MAEVPPFARNLTNMWLRDAATDLRSRASRMRKAYTREPLKSECERVADAYDRAAAVLAAEVPRG